MTNLVTASTPIVNERGATIQQVPVHFDAAWVKQAILELGPVTVPQLVKLSGRSETTARKLLKALVADGVLDTNAEVKPATYDLVVEPEVDDDAVAEALGQADAATDAAEAKLDALMDAITAKPQAEAPKVKKSRKVAHTDVPDEYDTRVRVNGERVPVTQAYALLENPPKLESVDEAYAWDNTVSDYPDRDHSPEEIAGAYYAAVADHLERLLDDGDITREVWYGRTFRLRRTLIGSGKGTASARPAKMTTE